MTAYPTHKSLSVNHRSDGRRNESNRDRSDRRTGRSWETSVSKWQPSRKNNSDRQRDRSMETDTRKSQPSRKNNSDRRTEGSADKTTTPNLEPGEKLKELEIVKEKLVEKTKPTTIEIIEIDDDGGEDYYAGTYIGCYSVSEDECGIPPPEPENEPGEDEKVCHKTDMDSPTEMDPASVIEHIPYDEYEVDYEVDEEEPRTIPPPKLIIKLK